VAGALGVTLSELFARVEGDEHPAIKCNTRLSTRDREGILRELAGIEGGSNG